ncbi:tripartite tricarboxylate transporter permease [Aestuariispira ectoiniformans]|uniref:tripartite tricarboxylate transporter permease n=1 Tax=Aestuariispira ectoiniformans TaxID=2775080 RepID=UPI00223B7390|nr:tripartite tricarboxylate transporter permease [Aestuariispira ectoiniformans]
MDQILSGMIDAMSLWTFLAVAGGVSIGIIVGAIPGLNAPMAIAIAVPLTMSMSPLAGIAMLVGVMKGGGYGGAIGAIMLNTPGEPHSAATTLDGHPLARRGKAKKALQTALFSSAFGDTCSDLVLITSAPALAVVALKAGPVEIAAFLVLSLSVIAALSGSSLLKGIFAAVLGAFLATVGLDPETASPRLTFGSVELLDGLPLVAVAIGVLAVPEIVMRMEERHTASQGSPIQPDIDAVSDEGIRFSEMWAVRATLLRGAGIGTVIGAIPGLGSTLAAFISYTATKRFSQKPEALGTGAIEGIAATESANSAVCGANLIPLLTLGIPGNLSAALLVGAFLIHGIALGPMIFTRNPELVYGLFAAMIMGNILVIAIGSIGLRLFAKIALVPAQVIYPVVLMLCLVGVYLSQRSLFAVWLMLGFGLLGYVMRKLDISIVCFAIGLVLGPIIELSARQSIILMRMNPGAILDHPLALGLFVATPVVVWVLLRDRKKQMAKEKAMQDHTTPDFPGKAHGLDPHP